MCGCLVAGLIVLGVVCVFNAIFGFHTTVIGLLVIIVAALIREVD